MPCLSYVQIGAQSVADGDVREGDAHANTVNSLSREEHDATLVSARRRDFS